MTRKKIISITIGAAALTPLTAFMTASPASAATVCDSMKSPAYHRVNPTRVGTLITPSKSEADAAAVKYGFTENHGTPFAASTVAAAGLIPIRSLVNSGSGDRLLVPAGTERDNAVNHWGYSDQGVKFYASPTASSCGTVAVIRYFKNNVHAYATTTAEHSALAAAGWLRENASFYGAKTWTPAPPAPAPTPPPTTRAFYINLTGQARTAITKYPSTAQYARVIADTAQAEWMTAPGIPTDQIQSRVKSYVGNAAAKNQQPVMVVYAIPFRDCSGGYSAGGLNSASEYASWIGKVAAGVAGRPVAIILEPDALADMNCLSAARQTERFAMLKNAVDTLAVNANIRVYLDAGTSRWMPADTMASRLSKAGVEKARGFSLNVASSVPTAGEVTYGNTISRTLAANYGIAGKTYVVDTSRNGNGPAAAGGYQSWCNARNLGLGVRPTTNTGQPLMDAALWIKRPGESDGSCGRGEPPAGTWFNDYAVGLVQRAQF